MRRYTPPTPLAADHARDNFNSGQPALDSWLRNRAARNEASGASRTFVTCPADERTVAGYYTLAAAAAALDETPGSVRRNMPDPIPVILLGRLAIDRSHQGAGLGASLMQDAVLRVARVGESVGVRALMVHAIDDSAAAFYRNFGFRPSPIDDQTLFLPLKQIRASVEHDGSP